MNEIETPFIELGDDAIYVETATPSEDDEIETESGEVDPQSNTNIDSLSFTEAVRKGRQPSPSLTCDRKPSHEKHGKEVEDNIYLCK